MNARTLSWSATLMALAMTVSMPARAQDSTGDPFLDAMLSDQQAAEEAQEKSPAAGIEIGRIEGELKQKLLEVRGG